MVEHIEEGVLGPLPHQVLDIVHDEDVDSLIESDEIHNPVALDGIHVLGLEFVPGDVENHLFLVFLLDGDADGLRDVRFPEAGAAEEEQGVERGFSGSPGDVLRCIDAQFVALPFHQVGEAVLRIEPGIDLEPLHPGENEGAGAAGRLIGGHRYGVVGGNGTLRGREHHAFLVPDRADQVEQLGIGPDGAFDGEPQKVFVSFLYILAEEVRRNLHREVGPLEGHRPDGREPGGELLRINVVFNDLQTAIPYRNMSFLVCHPGIAKKSALSLVIWIANLGEN